MKPLNERLYIYIIGMWYESRCKDKTMIKRIIEEEIQNNPEMEFKKLRLHTLRRCKSEL